MSQVTDHAAQTNRTENILGMRIIWDAAIEMDDGIVLRADVFLPEKEGKYPVVIALGPYAKGLSFQTGYKGSWDRMIAAYPEIAEGTTAKYANWELLDPEKWTRDGYVCLRSRPTRSCGLRRVSLRKSV